MAYYSDDVIEEVRSRNDIIDIIGGYVSLKHKGNSYTACCPFHHEKTPSFHVSRDKQMYHCFGCGVGGNVYTFIMEYENFSFPEAVKFLADRCGYQLPEQDMSEERKARENYKVVLKEINKAAAGYFHYLLMKTEHGEKAREYLKNRGFTEETIYNFGMGYADIFPNDLYQYLKSKGYKDDQLRDTGLISFGEDKGATDMFWNRVMVPITDINGKVIAFGGRVLGDGKPKYLNTRETPIFDKSHNLFAMNIARRSKKRGIIICEGYMDVISMHQAGFDNAVASLGTALTMGHANIIKRYTDEVYLAYDSDGAGTNATLKAIGIFREVGLTTRVIDMKPYKDPDEFIKNLGKEAYEERIRDAVTGIVFEVDTISGKFNLKDPEEKIKFTKDVARRLSSIEEPVARHSYIDAVADKYNLDRDGLKGMVTKYGTIELQGAVSETDVAAERSNNIRNEERGNNDLTKTQSILLTWMINDVRLFKILEGIISEEDFYDEDIHPVAVCLFAQYRDTGTVKPAAILDKFDDVDKQRVVAGIMQTELPFEMDYEEEERAINDLVRKAKISYIDWKLPQCTNDVEKFQDLIKMKARISKLHISLKNG
ncbi:MAG: DNA primase [Lachnospiraceae bacterium]|nr:DNA primase [Lachnospiraceae bacterium]